MCSVLEVDPGRIWRWATGAAARRLDDATPGSHPIHALLDWEIAEIVALAGGEWDFVMHGPDGTDYQEWICWTEIAPPEQIARLHSESRGDPNAFESVVTFAPVGAATRIKTRTVFPTKELRDEAVKKYDVIERGQQTLSNLAAYATEIVGD